MRRVKHIGLVQGVGSYGVGDVFTALNFYLYTYEYIYIIFVGENMQTNHDCYLTSLQSILGSNTVCPRLLTGLTVLILEYV